jgi:hypothetical protein
MSVVNCMTSTDGWRTVEMAIGMFAYAGSLPMAFRCPVSIITAQYQNLYAESKNASGAFHDEANECQNEDRDRVYGHPMTATWANTMQSLIRKASGMMILQPVVGFTLS